MNERIRVPKWFIEDHASRGLLDLESVKVGETKTHYFVELSPEQAYELWHDADFYSCKEMAGEFMESMGLGFVSSARATKKALNGFMSFVNRCDALRGN
jgi:hypothetical protein